MLNNDIVALIISKADVSIDTYLAFKNIGAKPKKLKQLDIQFKEKLDRIFKIRKYYYKNIKNQTDSLLYYHNTFNEIKLRFLKRLNESIHLHIIYKIINYAISIDYKSNNIVYHFIVKQQDWIIRHEIYDLHTGEYLYL